MLRRHEENFTINQLYHTILYHTYQKWASARRQKSCTALTDLSPRGGPPRELQDQLYDLDSTLSPTRYYVPADRAAFPVHALCYQAQVSTQKNTFPVPKELAMHSCNNNQHELSGFLEALPVAVPGCHHHYRHCLNDCIPLLTSTNTKGLTPVRAYSHSCNVRSRGGSLVLTLARLPRTQTAHVQCGWMSAWTVH